MQTKNFIRRKELLQKIGLCATSIYNLEKAGQFPQHILLTPRAAVWSVEAVEEWMAARITAPTCGAKFPCAKPREKAGEAV